MIEAFFLAFRILLIIVLVLTIMLGPVYWSWTRAWRARNVEWMYRRFGSMNQGEKVVHVLACLWGVLIFLTVIILVAQTLAEERADDFCKAGHVEYCDDDGGPR